MGTNYEGLPAAASVEQSIILAQLVILKDQERRAQSANMQRLLNDLLIQRPAA